MPTARNPVTPITPAGGLGGTNAVPISTIPCDPGVAFSPGDPTVIDAGTRDAQLGATPIAAAGTTLGIAMCREFTANATIDRNGNVAEAGAPGAALTGDCINVALAMPGSRFNGAIVTSTYGIETGVYADNIRVKLGLVQCTVSGYFAIEQSSTSVDVVFPLEYVSPQRLASTGVWQYGREAGVGIVNPRVIFTFLLNATVFGIAIA